MKLKKSLGLFDIYSIASGAMISSGIFILPAVAFARTGPSVVYSYLLAGLAAILGVLNVIELVTAMPRAGGDYYYIARTLGPLVGTVSGILSWAALSLKSSFAIFGLSTAGYLILGVPPLWTSWVMVLLFVALNMVGAELASRAEGIMVALLLALMAVFVATGLGSVEPGRFTPMLPRGMGMMLSTAGFVFVSFGGLINVATVSEEVRNPKRNLPLGMFLSIGSIVLLYAAAVVVMIGNMPSEQLARSLAPVADTARITLGLPGFIAVTAAALLAFLTTANAGILSASRYPMALARDRLLPAWMGRVGRRSGAPLFSVAFTGVVIGLSLFLPLELLVKAASSVVLAANILAALSVMIMRASGLAGYRPSFRVRLYPYLQITAIAVFGFLLVDIGLEAVEVSLGLVALGLLVYFLYGRRRWKREFALLHLIERATDRELTGDHLESELIAILHERDETTPDSVDGILADATYRDLSGPFTAAELFEAAAGDLWSRFPSEDLVALLRRREAAGSTALTPFFAIPHIIVGGTDRFHLLVIRCREGVTFSDDRPDVRAVFFLVGSRDMRTLHLKVLAALAQIVQEAGFESDWMDARGPKNLRSMLLSAKRGRFH